MVDKEELDKLQYSEWLGEQFIDLVWESEGDYVSD